MRDADSIVSRPRRTLLTLGLPAAALIVLFAVALSVSVGSKGIPLDEVWRSLTGNGSDYANLVVQARLPRTVLGLLVGSALAVAGAVMQGISRNPLGDPGLLGINAGASASIVTGTALFGSAVGTGTWFALPGALVAAILVFALGSNRGGATPVRLILAGAVITAVLGAYVQAMTLSLPLVFESYRFWVIGSISAATWGVVTEVAWTIAAALVAAIMLARSLNTLSLGDEVARSLGSSPAITRALGIAVVAILAASATAAAGPIGFVGLAVPHILRPFIGSDYRWLIPYSALLGAGMLLYADIIARVIVRPGELMVGTVTAFLGAPFLILAVRRMRRR